MNNHNPKGGGGGGNQCDMVYLHQLAKIKFRSFQDLDFSDENILQGVDASCRLFYLSTNHLRYELCNQLLQIT